MRELIARLRDWLRRDRLDVELADELRFHSEMLSRDARSSGVQPDDAPYAARRALGNRHQCARGDARSLVGHVARSFSAGRPLRRARPAPKSGLHRRRRADAWTRHRRERGDVQRDRPADVPAVSVICATQAASIASTSRRPVADA